MNEGDSYRERERECIVFSYCHPSCVWYRGNSPDSSHQDPLPTKTKAERHLNGSSEKVTLDSE